jgi:hypothetical protein
MGDLTSDPAELSLSAEEIGLLQLLGHGLPLETVARRLRTSERTVRRRTKPSATGSASTSPSRRWPGPHGAA